MILGLWFVYGELRDFLARHGWSSGSNTISSKLTTSSTGSSSFSPSVWLLHSMKLDYQFMYSINHIAVFMFFSDNSCKSFDISAGVCSRCIELYDFPVGTIWTLRLISLCGIWLKYL